MISSDQVQQVFNTLVQWVTAHPSVVTAVAGATFTVAVYAWHNRKGSPASVARAWKKVRAAPEPYSSKPYTPDLPLPDATDYDYARQFPEAGFSSWYMGPLYSKGRDEGDLHLAMTGLRLYTQFIVDGGEKTISSPWPEYQTLSGGYVKLAKTHNSRQCLELAYKALQGCYHNIYSEPATVQLERDVSAQLHALKTELEASAFTPSD